MEHNRRYQSEALASWRNWLTEGPACGLRRQHKVSRTADGWIPAKVAPAEQPDVALDPYTEEEEQLLHAAQGGVLEVPLDAQQTAEALMD